MISEANVLYSNEICKQQKILNAPNEKGLAAYHSGDFPKMLFSKGLFIFLTTLSLLCLLLRAYDLDELLADTRFPIPATLIDETLEKACICGQVEVVKRIIFMNDGGNSSSSSSGPGCDKKGLAYPISKLTVPIRLAATNGHANIVNLLIEYGVNLKSLDNDPIWLASQNGHLEVVKVLLEHGSGLKDLPNASIRAASEHGHVELVKFLLDKGADPKDYNDEAIRYASENGHSEVVKLLLENGANPTAMDNYPIVHSAKYGHSEVVKLLLKFGANPRARNNEAVKVALENGHSEIAALLKDGIVERMLLNNFTQHDPMGVLNLSKVRLVPGIPKSTVSLNLIQDLGLANELEFIKEMGLLDKLCSAAKNVKLEFVGLNVPNVNVTKISGSNGICILNLIVSWPSDLTLLAERNISIKGQFMLSKGFIGIRPLEFGTVLYYPEYSLSHPSIGNTSAFFVGELLDLNFQIDKFNGFYRRFVDGNYSIFMSNHVFIKSNKSKIEYGLRVISKTEKYHPFFKFSINGTKYRINLKQSYSTSFHQAEAFFGLPKRAFGLNEGISVNWIKGSPYLELLKRNISLQVSRMGSNSSVFLKRVLPQSGFVSFPPLSSLLTNETDPFGSYVVKLIDMDGIIAFGEEGKRYFDIVRPTVDRIGLNQSASDNNVTVSVFWESKVCSALANVTKLNGILKANLTVTMQNESIYSVDLESYCILAHQFKLPIGNLSFNTNYELKVSLFDTIEGIQLATGNGTLFIAREVTEPTVSPSPPLPPQPPTNPPQEPNILDDPLKLSLLIGGIVIVLASIGAVWLLMIRRRRKRLAEAKCANAKLDSVSVHSNSIFSITNGGRKLYSY